MDSFLSGLNAAYDRLNRWMVYVVVTLLVTWPILILPKPASLIAFGYVGLWVLAFMPHLVRSWERDGRSS